MNGRMDNRNLHLPSGWQCRASFLWIPGYVDRRIECFQSDLVDQHYAEVESMYRTMRGWRHD